MTPNQKEILEIAKQYLSVKPYKMERSDKLYWKDGELIISLMRFTSSDKYQFQIKEGQNVFTIEIEPEGGKELHPLFKEAIEQLFISTYKNFKFEA